MSKKTNNLTIILLLIAACIFTLQANADEPDAGQIAPDFEIMQMDGTTFRLSDYKGKQSVYLVFWNTWCHFCMKKIPKLKAAELNLSDDIKIIAVNTTNKDSIEESIEFQQRFKINYSLAFDNGKKVTDLYNVWGTPTEFIIDINGIIQHRDGVPEKLESYLGDWNHANRSYTQVFKAYFDIINSIFNKVSQAS